ncbi:a1801f25-5670-4417-b772-decc30c01f2b [Thermothielavioides terrestris]
MYWH